MGRDGTVTYDVDRTAASWEINSGGLFDVSESVTTERRAADGAAIERDAQAWLRNAAGGPAVSADLPPAQRGALQWVAHGSVRLLWPRTGATTWTIDGAPVRLRRLSGALDDAYNRGMVHVQPPELDSARSARVDLTDAGRAALTEGTDLEVRP